MVSKRQSRHNFFFFYHLNNENMDKVKRLKIAPPIYIWGDIVKLFYKVG